MMFDWLRSLLSDGIVGLIIGGLCVLDILTLINLDKLLGIEEYDEEMRRYNYGFACN